MKRKKIKADNVEQLMEIVRSLQRGEEPSQEKIRERTQEKAPQENTRKHGQDEEKGRMRARSQGSEGDLVGARGEDEEKGRMRARSQGSEGDPAGARSQEKKAESDMEETGTGARTENSEELWEDEETGESLFQSLKNGMAAWRESRERKKKESDLKEGWEEDGEFERLLQDSDSELPDMEKIRGRIAKMVQAVSSKHEAAKRQKAEESQERKEKEKNEDHSAALPAQTEDELSIEPESQHVFERLTGQAKGEETTALSAEQERKPEASAGEAERQETAGQDALPAAGQERKPEASAGEAERQETAEQDALPSAGQERKPEAERQEMAEQGVSSSAGQETKPGASAGEAERQEMAEQGVSPSAGQETKPGASVEEEAKSSGREGQPAPRKTRGSSLAESERRDGRAGLRRRKTQEEKEEELKRSFAPERRTLPDFIRDLIWQLGQRGIGKREFAMLGAVLVFVILLVLLAFRMIAGSIEEKKKSEHVTADEGLKVTVEDEPETWCGTYPVKLRFSSGGAQIQSIQINGTDFTADENGIVTVRTGEWLLEAVVETDAGTRSARIEVPFLDGERPVVYVSQKNDAIELTAVDARSSVTGIYVAFVKEGSLTEVPQYQKYSEPFARKEHTTYYFYAEDAAGNRSVPVASSMEQAVSIALERQSLELYPEETKSLMAEAVPEGALLQNLKYESMNPELLAVDGFGRVTALAKGTGAVRITADHVEPVICTVTVSDTRTVTISAIGDCTLGSDESFNTTTNFQAYDLMNGHAYFFRNVRSVLEEDDATFANLEGTLTTQTTRENKEYAFRGDPSYSEVLTQGSVEVVTLANNHSSDYGAQSLTDTQNALELAGISYCKGDTIAIRELNGIPTAFVGIYVLDQGMGREEQVRKTVADAKAKGAQLVIVGFHWGTEKADQPDETQKALAHAAIDSGADLVVGHHPHVLQPVELYNGKYIAYSLGNFCFGGNSMPSDTDTMIFRQTFAIGKDGEAQTDAVTVIPCSVTSASGYNNYQPTVLEGEASSRVLARLNELSAPYGVSFSGDGTVSS